MLFAVGTGGNATETCAVSSKLRCSAHLSPRSGYSRFFGSREDGAFVPANGKVAKQHPVERTRILLSGQTSVP